MNLYKKEINYLTFILIFIQLEFIELNKIMNFSREIVYFTSQVGYYLFHACSIIQV